MRKPRLQAVLTGKFKQAGAIEAHVQNVLAITRAIHRLERRQKQLREQQRATATELRARRRELRAVLQRDSSITEDRLAAAGHADALDATAARSERRWATT